MKQWQEKKEEIPIIKPVIVTKNKDADRMKLMMELENQLDENGGLISLPLFRVSGTSMDIEKLFEKLKENDKPLGGENSYMPNPGPLSTQWKTRIG